MAASRLPPLPRRGEPSSASPHMQPRRPSAGVCRPGRRRRGQWWHRAIRLPPQDTSRRVGGKEEPSSTTLSTMVLSPSYDPGMLCPLPRKTSPAPQTTTAEGHRLLLALLPREEPGPPGAALPQTTGAGRAGCEQAGVKPPSPAACSQRKYKVPESSTSICQGTSQAFKCRGCPRSACAGTAAPVPVVWAASPAHIVGRIPTGSA